MQASKMLQRMQKTTGAFLLFSGMGLLGAQPAIAGEPSEAASTTPTAGQTAYPAADTETGLQHAIAENPYSADSGSFNRRYNRLVSGSESANGACSACETEAPCTACQTCDTGWCDLGEAFSLSDALFGGEDHGINVGGWTQWGYHNEGNGLFNNHPNNFNNHQSYLYVEKVADGSNGLDWGFRFDTVYGVDAQDTQAFGNPPGSWDFMNGYDHGIYGWALPQAYGEIASGDWSVKFGHFYTLVGYEVVTAPDNFFYSHAYTMFNSEPFTHTGVVSTYTVSDNVEVYGGWTAGWDTGFDQFRDGSNFLGGAALTLTENITLTYITTFGDFGAREEGYSHSLVLDTQVTDKINYVFQSDLVSTNSGTNNDQLSVNQYLFYEFNECLKAGTRVEWWKNDGNSQYEATWGVNVKPHANLVIRPEYRYDWNPGTGQEFDTVGIDAILTF